MFGIMIYSSYPKSFGSHVKFIPKLFNTFCSAIETILNEASMLAMLNKKEKIEIDDITLAAQKTNCRLNMKLLKR